MCDDCGNKDGSVSLHLICQACKDYALFKQPPLGEDCPICFLQVPFMSTGRKYQSCCGKVICSGCIHAVQMMDGKAKCPFCRVPMSESDEELIERYTKRVEMDDVEAIYCLGCFYNGELNFPQDRARALEFWHRAGELGNASAYYNIGNAYYLGNGVERDVKKAKHYWELAALGGHVGARGNLGIIEEYVDNDMNQALKHHMIAVGRGNDKSLKQIREFYVNGHATKDDYAKALRAHQKYIDGIKSAERDEAAAYNSEKYRYY